MADSNWPVDRRTVLAGMGVGTAGLAGCVGLDGDDDDDDPDADDDATPDPDAEITVTAVWTETEQDNFEAVLDHVEEESGHSTSYQPRDTESLLSETLLDYENETTPADIAVIPMAARVQTDGGAGHLEPVGDLWDVDDFTADPESVSVDGEVYAAPFGMDLKPGFWYRRSFFDEHDLEEPESYDEFIDLLDDLSEIDEVDAPLASGNGVGWPLSDVVEAYILRQDDGAQLQLDLITGDAEFTDDRVYSAFEEVQETLQDGYWSELEDFGIQYERFWENELPLYFMGSWTPGEGAIEDPDDLGVFPLPGVDGMVAAVNWFTVPTYGDEVDASMDVLEHIISPEGQQVWTERGGFVPSHEAVPEDAFEDQIMADLVNMADDFMLVPDLDDDLGDPFQSEFWSELLGLWAEPDSDVDTIVERLDDAHQDTLED